MKQFTISQSMTRFQSEISLFIKTFFFVYLGIIVDLSTVNLKIVLIVIGLVVLAIMSRIFSIKLMFRKKELKGDSKYVLALHARGLAAAVLATYPLTIGLTNQYTLIILPIAFLVIILTNLSTTIFFFFADKDTKNNDDSNDSSKEENIKELVKVNDKINPVIK
jgi:cell volume regulation protein A